MPILILAVLAIVLILIVVVIVARMCCSQSATVTKQETVLRKLDTGPQEEQYTVKADDEKSMFAGRR